MRKLIDITEEEELVKLYEETEDSVVVLAKTFNRDPSSIYRILKRNKVSARKKKKFDEMTESVQKDYVEGILSIVEMFAKYKIRAGILYKHVRHLKEARKKATRAIAIPVPYGHPMYYIYYGRAYRKLAWVKAKARDKNKLAYAMIKKGKK